MLWSAFEPLSSVISGVTVEVGPEAVWVRSIEPLSVLSSAVVGGGLASTRHIVNMHVDLGYRGDRPADDLRAFARRLGIGEPFVGLMTAAWTHEAATVSEKADGVTVTAVATVGLGTLVAAGVTPPAPWRPSTINTVVILDARLEPGEAERRHLEAIYKARLAVVEDLRGVIEEQRKEMERAQRRIGELELRISEMHQKEAETVKAFEALTTAAHERALELGDFERSQARKDRALEELTPLARSVAARFGLAKAEGPADLVDALVAFKRSLRPEQMASIGQVLSPEQGATLINLFDVLPKVNGGGE